MRSSAPGWSSASSWPSSTRTPIQLLVLSAIVNGVAAGPFLIVMMLITRDEQIMGRYRNGRLAQVLGWSTTTIMCVAGGYGVWYTISGG